jgi:hypothetical protein
LKTVDYYIDTRTGGLNALLLLAARSSHLRSGVQKLQPLGRRIARRLGPKASCLAIEVEDADGRLFRLALYCPDRGYRLAVLPAALAVQALVMGGSLQPGVVPPDQQVGDVELRAALESVGARLLAAAQSGRS